MQVFKKVFGLIAVLFCVNASIAQTTFYVTERNLGTGSGTLNTILTSAVNSANQGNAVTVYFNVAPDANGRTFVVIDQQLAAVNLTAGSIVLTKDPSNTFIQGMEFAPNVNFQAIFHAGGSSVRIKELGIRSLSSVNDILCPKLENPISFYNSSANPCSNVSFQYSIASVAGAVGYEWSYTGSGASIKLVSASEATPMVAMNGIVNFTSTTGNDVYVSFNENFTAGTLTVRAYKFCTATNQNIYSSQLSIAIAPDESVQFLVSNDSVFNCQQYTLPLTASCTVPGSTYSWGLIGNPLINSNTGTLQASVDDQAGNQHAYVVSISYPFGGKTSCSYVDTVHIIKDTVKPTILFNAVDTVTLDCLNHTELLNASASETSILLNWHLENGNYPNPVTIDSSMVSTGTYYLVAYNPTNFCQDSMAVEFYSSFDLPPVPYLNDQLYTIGEPVGIVGGCREEGLSVIASNLVGGNYTFDWIGTDLPNQNETVLSGTFLNDTLVISGKNRCVRILNVFADADLTIPAIIPMADQQVNCSFPRIDLEHPTNNCFESGWYYQQDGVFLEIDILANVTEGTYVYAFVDSVSGCKNYDTVVVTNTQLLEFNTYSLPRICEGDTFSLNPLVLYTGTETLNYLWDDLSTNSVYTAEAVADETVTVNVTTASGCHGDLAIPVDVVQALSPVYEQVSICGGSADGINVIPGYAEAAPVQYSFNGHPYSDQEYLQLDTLGVYTIAIKDANNCVYEHTWEVSTLPIAPDPYFLMSSYNLPDAIVAVVNTSEYYYDSVAWELPDGVYFSYENDSVRYLQASDTGYFNIKMFAYIDSCVFEVSKLVYFGNDIPVDFDVSEGKGIVNISIGPNPATTDFLVVVEFGIPQYSFMYLTDLAGHVLQSAPLIYAGAYKHVFTGLENYAAGDYILHVVCDFDAYYKKIIITN